MMTTTLLENDSMFVEPRGLQQDSLPRDLCQAGHQRGGGVHCDIGGDLQQAGAGRVQRGGGLGRHQGGLHEEDRDKVSRLQTPQQWVSGSRGGGTGTL